MKKTLPPDLLRRESQRAVGISPEKVRRWREDPRVFAQEVTNVHGDIWQEKFWAALGGPHLDPLAKPRLALEACKGPGKTFALAVGGWWWLFTRWHANGIVCSITADNLRDNLWAEFARIQNGSPILQHFFNVRGERIEAKEHPKTWWLSARSFPQNADKNQQANTLAGLHGRHPIVLLDEIGDYPDGVVVAAEAIFANDVDARLVAAGNPTNPEGPLYRICNRDRQYWWVMEITGDPDDPNCASRINKEENRKLIKQWGPTNPYVLVNVFGKFPPQGWDQLIGPLLVEQAMAREPDPRMFQREPVVWGLDPSGRGVNESVLAKRQGVALLNLRTWRTSDTMVLCDQVAVEWERERPTKFFVDSGGLGGPICDRFAQLGVDVVRVDGGNAAAEDDKFFDKRTEMWWAMAQWLKTGCIPKDGKLRADLTAPKIDYRITNKKTKFRLETKAEMLKRGIESPDHGDALALTFASPVFGSRTDDDPMGLLSNLSRVRGNQKIIGGTEDDWNPLGDD